MMRMWYRPEFSIDSDRIVDQPKDGIQTTKSVQQTFSPGVKFVTMKDRFMKTSIRTLLTIGLLAWSLAAIRAADTKETYEKQCASCHGKDGKGQTKMGRQSGAKDYTDPKVQEAMKDDAATKQIKDGMTEKGKEKMKPFKDKLTDDEIKALIGYMRAFKAAK
jgi:cytochrome c553